MADQGQRTEQPTPRRLDKARKEGRFPVSREFVAALSFLAFAWMFASLGRSWFDGARDMTRYLLRRAFTANLTAGEAVRLAQQLALRQALPLVGAGLGLALVPLAVHLATTKLGFSLKALAPDLKRLNPIERLRQLPSQNIPAFFQALFLLPLFVWAAYAVVKGNLEAYLALPLASVESGAAKVASSLQQLIWKAAGLFLVFGCVDLFRQRRRYMNQLRMTKQEIREEFKEAEGNPQVKMRIRRLRRDLLRRKMMQEVPTATAVIVNPTHYAVAIRYQPAAMAAPKVVAKGKNYLAQRIRKLALEHQIPIVENPPLAQALYKSVDVGQEIPPHLYQAVAEILAYIYKLMKGRLPGMA
jgi:flagellar biosynthesis protein FlhB